MTLPSHIRPDLFAILPERPAILALDFDGVMTDDRVWTDQDGREAVACTRGDGLGITLLRRAEFPVVVLSTEPNHVVTARCRKLGIECLQGIQDKAREFDRILAERGIPAESAIYVGNDVNDLGCLRLAGCGLVVADSHPLARHAAKGVLTHAGGRGAVREVAEMILLRLGHPIVYNRPDEAERAR